MSNRRQQIVDAIEARLELIQPGYTVTLPDGPYVCSSTVTKAFPWRKAPFSKTERPGVRFMDEDADVQPGPSTQHESKLNFTLEGMMSGTTSASSARALLADVVAVIGSDPRWAGLAYWTDIHTHAVDLEQAGDVISACRVLFTVTYRTPLWRM